MWITKDDFRIRADSFDLSNGLNILRIICGLFMFPHVMGKFAAGAVSAATVGFFAKAGFHPPELWVYIAAICETEKPLSSGLYVVWFIPSLDHTFAFANCCKFWPVAASRT